MATITAAIVKELRDQTGAGMMLCKKALQENDGDMNAAIEFLRTKGAEAAQKKSSRTAKEGLVVADSCENYAAIIEVNSETDFVSRNDDFKAFVSDLMKVALEKKPANLEEFMKTDSSIFGKPVENILTDKIGIIGENLLISRLEAVSFDSSNTVETYIHGEGKIGVIAKLNSEVKDNEDVKTCAKDICLHVAALAPLTMKSEDLDPTIVAQEKKIYKEIALQEGKPEKILDRIIDGKINRFYKENCLLDQQFVKDPDLTVAKLISGVGSKVGGSLELESYTRVQLGA